MTTMNLALAFALTGREGRTTLMDEQTLRAADDGLAWSITGP